MSNVKKAVKQCQDMYTTQRTRNLAIANRLLVSGKTKFIRKKCIS